MLGRNAAAERSRAPTAAVCVGAHKRAPSENRDADGDMGRRRNNANRGFGAGSGGGQPGLEVPGKIRGRPDIPRVDGGAKRGHLARRRVLG